MESAESAADSVGPTVAAAVGAVATAARVIEVHCWAETVPLVVGQRVGPTVVGWKAGISVREIQLPAGQC